MGVMVVIDMGVVMIFKYGKRFRFTPSFNGTKKVGISVLLTFGQTVVCILFELP